MGKPMCGAVGGPLGRLALGVAWPQGPRPQGPSPEENIHIYVDIYIYIYIDELTHCRRPSTSGLR